MEKASVAPTSERSTAPDDPPHPVQPTSDSSSLPSSSWSLPYSSSLSSPSLSFLPRPKAMIKLWPAMFDQLTPRANADGRERSNPFEAPSSTNTTLSPSSPRSSLASLSSASTNGPQTPTLLSPSSAIHHLGTIPGAIPAHADITPPGPLTPPSWRFCRSHSYN
ncbi:hypothetical protein BU15DRAFT_69831 [Melanogaster broomeanus]|nr:hypothetical protein BU15DRAFT_69831 [Melanogaster broomeanus]